MAFLAAPAEVGPRSGWRTRSRRRAPEASIRGGASSIGATDASATAAAAVRRRSKHPGRARRAPANSHSEAPVPHGHGGGEAAGKPPRSTRRRRFATRTKKLLAQVARLGRDNDRLNEAQAGTTVAEPAARASSSDETPRSRAKRLRAQTSRRFSSGAAKAGASPSRGRLVRHRRRGHLHGRDGGVAVAVVTVAGVVGVFRRVGGGVLRAKRLASALALPSRRVAVDEDDVVLADRATEARDSSRTRTRWKR